MLFLIIILGKTISFSQNISENIQKDSIVWITSEQLKKTNLIFLEHEYLLKNNYLLNKQLDNYKLEVKLLEELDSVRINEMRSLISSHNLQLNNLNKEIKKKDNILLTWKICGITISTGLLIWCLLR